MSSFFVFAEDCCILYDNVGEPECIEYSTPNECEDFGASSDYSSSSFDSSCSHKSCNVGCCVYYNELSKEMVCDSSSDMTEYICESIYSDSGFVFVDNEFDKCQDYCSSGAVVYGYVRDQLTNNPLPNAEITFSSDDNTYVSISQPSGFYMIPDPTVDSEVATIVKDTYDVSVKKPGYSNLIDVYSINDDDNEIDLYLISGSSLTSNVGSISGRVITQESEIEIIKVPIENALISIPPTGTISEMSILSDNQGNFLLENVPVGQYVLTISKSGKLPEQVQVTVEKDSNTNLETISLSQTPSSSGDSICCTYGCENPEGIDRSKGYYGVCESGSGIYCKGSNDDVCLKSSNYCCYSSEYCDSYSDTPNICSRDGLFGCNNECSLPNNCQADDLVSVTSGSYCKCGSDLISTTDSGYCCSPEFGENYYTLNPCSGIERFIISGIMIDELTGRPMKDVLVWIILPDESRTMVAYSDDQGFFSKELPSGYNYELYISKTNYNTTPSSSYDLTTISSSTSVSLVNMFLDDESGYRKFRFNLQSDIDFGNIYLSELISSCDMPDGSKTYVENLDITASERGISDLRLFWDPMACSELVSYEIWRKTFTADPDDEEEFHIIAYIPLTHSDFIDKNVEWDTKYSYLVIPYYKGGLRPDGLDVVGSSISYDESYLYHRTFWSGNVTCADRKPTLKNTEFCSALEFGTGRVASKAFFRYQCDENNYMVPTDDLSGIEKTYSDCSDFCSTELGDDCDFVCAGPSDVGTTKCVATGVCNALELGAEPFGLYYDESICYGSSFGGQGNVAGERYENYCTYDTSNSIVQSCNDCTEYKDCSDYKSQGACEIDNCVVSSGSVCVWLSGEDLQSTSSGTYGVSSDPSLLINYDKPDLSELLFGDLGEGFCVRANPDPKKDDYCSLCSATNAPFNANLGCTTEVCSFLGDCFSDGNSCASCNERSSCEAYKTQDECIGIGADRQNFTMSVSLEDLALGTYSVCSELPGGCNGLLTYSNDPCGNNYCKWIPKTESENGGYCIKDGNNVLINHETDTENLMSDCSEAGIHSVNCPSSTDEVKLTMISFEPTMNHDAQIIFKASKNLTLNALSGFDGFMYCIDRENNCVPTSVSGPYHYPIVKYTQNGKTYSDEVTINPTYDFNVYGADSWYVDEGLYYIRYMAVDQDLNVGKINSIPVMYDMTPPTINVVHLVQLNASGPKKSKMMFNIELSEFSSCYDRLENLETGEVYDSLIGNHNDADELSRYDTQSIILHSVTYENLDDGFHRYELYCKDMNGNVAHYSDNNFLVDAYKSIFIIEPNFLGPINTLTTDFKIRTDDASICLLNYNGEQIGQFSDDPDPLLNKYVISAGSIFSTFSLEENRLYNNAEFEVICYDALTDNPDSINKYAKFSVDLDAPETTAIASSNGRDDVDLTSVEYSLARWNDDVYVRFSCVDKPYSFDSNYLFGCNETYYCTTTDSQGCTPDKLVSDENNSIVIIDETKTICFRSVDGMQQAGMGGNWEETICKSILIDKMAPIINIENPSDLTYNDVTNEYSFITDVSNPFIFSGSIEENDDITNIEISITNGVNVMALPVPVTRNSVTGNFDFEANWNLLALGQDNTSYDVVATAYDLAGNVGTGILNLYYDNEAPIAENFEIVLEDETISVDNIVEYGNHPFTLNVDVSDKHWTNELSELKIDIVCVEGPCQYYPLEYSLIDELVLDDNYITQSEYSFHISPTTDNIGLYNFKSGRYVLRIRARDSFDYYDEYEFPFEIKDMTPPKIWWLNPLDNVTNSRRNHAFSFGSNEPTTCELIMNLPDEKTFEMTADDLSVKHYVNLPMVLPDGSYDFLVNCSEIAGENNIAEFFTFKVDTVSPKLLMSSSRGIANDNTQENIQEYTLDYYSENQLDLIPEIVISDVNENTDSIICSYSCFSPNSECPSWLTSGTFGSKNIYKLEQRFSFDFKRKDMPAGDYYFDIFCEDQAGNIAKTNNLVFRINGPRESKIVDVGPCDIVNSNTLDIKVKTSSIMSCDYSLYYDYNGYYGEVLNQEFDQTTSTGLVHRVSVDTVSVVDGGNSEEQNLISGIYPTVVKCVDSNNPGVELIYEDCMNELDYVVPNVTSSELVQIASLPAFKIDSDENFNSDITGYSFELSNTILFYDDFDDTLDVDGNVLAFDPATFNSYEYINLKPIDAAGNVGSNMTKKYDFDYYQSNVIIDYVLGAIKTPGVDNEYSTSDNSVTISSSSNSEFVKNMKVYSIEVGGNYQVIGQNQDNSITIDNVVVDYGRNDFYVEEYVDETDDDVDNGYRTYYYLKIYRDNNNPNIVVHPLDILNTDEKIKITTDEDTLCSVEYYLNDGFMYSEDFGTTYAREHELSLSNQILIDDRTGIALITINCRDKSANFMKKSTQIRVDTQEPAIVSYDVNGYYDEAENKYKLVRDNLALITVNADEFVKCKFDYEDKTYADMNYYSDDFDNYLLHPRIGVRLEENFDGPIYFACIDKANKLSIVESLNFAVMTNSPYIIVDPLPDGNIDELNPTISVKTFRDATCRAKFVKEESGEGALAFIMNIIDSIFSDETDLEKSYDGEYYTHYASLSRTRVNDGSGSPLLTDSDYVFEVICRDPNGNSDGKIIEDGSGELRFKINYQDFEAPVATITINNIVI